MYFYYFYLLFFTLLHLHVSGRPELSFGQKYQKSIIHKSVLEFTLLHLDRT